MDTVNSVGYLGQKALPTIEEETIVVSLQGTSQGSQDSLDKHSSLPRMKSYDAAVFDVLKVPPEEFAVSVNLLTCCSFFFVRNIVIEMFALQRCHIKP